MADAADRASDVIEQNLAQALASRHRPLPVATDPECEDCGNEIPDARRHAVPWATTCIECQGIREQKASRWR